MDQGLRQVKKSTPPQKKRMSPSLKNNYNNPCEYEIIRSIIN